MAERQERREILGRVTPGLCRPHCQISSVRRQGAPRDGLSLLEAGQPAIPSRRSPSRLRGLAVAREQIHNHEFSRLDGDTPG